MSRHAVQGSSSFALRGATHLCPWAEPDDPAPAAASRPRDGARLWPWVAAVAVLLALSAWQLGGAAWIHVKARLAQHLIASAWTHGAASGKRHAPWPGADMRPVARLAVPSRGVSLFVLSGTSGRSLAFGPGHVDGTALPGASGNSVIVAHRDTHFAFLRHLHPDDEITVEDARGRLTRYRVRETVVTDKHDTRLLDPADSPQLTLITCWPFDAVRPGGPGRYVVIAERA